MRVVRNTDGAVMVMAVFMAMIAIGALYYLVGLGDAIVAQERMQDAADAAAFSSAVIHARGMNLLALLNLLMASVLAILVLLSMLASLFKMGIAILTIASFLFPLAAGGIPPLETATTTAQEAERIARPQVEKVLRAGHAIQGPLNQMIPLMANLNAMKLARNSYRPVVSAAITFPIFTGMPTVDGDFDTLCKKAGDIAGKLAVFPITGTLRVIGKLTSSRVTGFIARPLERMAKKAGRTYAQFYCGSGPKPKPIKHTEEEPIPHLNSHLRVACDKEESGACKKYSEQLESVRNAYSEEKGICESEGAVHELCEQRRRRARVECEPGTGPQKIDITWRAAKKIRRFRLVGEAPAQRVVEEEPETVGQPRVKTDSAGAGNFALPFACKGQGGGFSSSPMTKWDYDLENPVCHTKIDVPTVGDFRFRDADLIEKPITEITDVLSCTQEKVLTLNVSGEKIDGDLKKNTPREMCNCAALGEEMFQIRSIVKGDAESLTAQSSKAILIATQGRGVDESAVTNVGSFAGGFAAAQAEFYFSGDENKPELWLWEMKWKARLRRLSFGGPQWNCPEEKNTCPGESDKNPRPGERDAARFGALRTFLKDNMNAVIVH